MRTTHTYVTLPLSPSAFAEIKEKLEAAGYQHAFDTDKDDGLVIDMHGLAVIEEKSNG